ncbi:iron-siderophore ABC transporter substrate-binding protein [Rhizobium sp. S152]|uniref:iron-siderophore ABC transporter substrate-binding protein n=1 Tax=Rhizobium sp. S152 TaxID=3055038 RepID=UPI003FA6F3BC
MASKHNRPEPGIARRHLLRMLALASVFPRSALAAAPRRVAAIDWAMLETVMALGVVPIAATELIKFRSDAREPVVPDSVADLGLRGAPNYELLHLLKPDMILSSPFYTRQKPVLEAIAPVVSMPFYVKGEPPFEKALTAVRDLGRLLDRADAAKLVLDQAAAMLEATRTQLQPFAVRPTYVINIGDARHFRAFGADSMFGDILARLGLANAWTDQSRFTFAAPVPIEDLAARPDARIVVVSDIPVEARTGLRDSMIWRSLEPVKAGRVVMIGNVNPYGGITAGLRFARLLRDGLLGQAGAL